LLEVSQSGKRDLHRDLDWRIHQVQHVIRVHMHVHC